MRLCVCAKPHSYDQWKTKYSLDGVYKSLIYAFHDNCAVYFTISLSLSRSLKKRNNNRLLRNFKLMIEIVITMKFNKRPRRYESVDNNGFWGFKCSVCVCVLYGIKFNDVKFNVWKISLVKMTDCWND